MMTKILKLTVLSMVLPMLFVIQEAKAEVGIPVLRTSGYSAIALKKTFLEADTFDFNRFQQALFSPRVLPGVCYPTTNPTYVEGFDKKGNLILSKKKEGYATKIKEGYLAVGYILTFLPGTRAELTIGAEESEDADALRYYSYNPPFINFQPKVDVIKFTSLKEGKPFDETILKEGALEGILIKTLNPENKDPPILITLKKGELIGLKAQETMELPKTIKLTKEEELKYYVCLPVIKIKMEGKRSIPVEDHLYPTLDGMIKKP